MSVDASKVVVESLVKGGFDALEALLGTPFSFDVTETVAASDEAIQSLVVEFPVCLQASIEESGSAILLLSIEDTAKLLSLVNGDDPPTKTTLEDDDLPTLVEIAPAVLGGGVAMLGGQYGEDLLLEGSDASWEKQAPELSDYVGDPAVIARFTFSADPHFDTQGVIIYTQSLEHKIPGAEGADAAEVSDEEVQDILSGFTPEDETDHMGGAAAVQGNLSVILDIELVATARLGIVEMPIADVLNFGPGSIIEVGHLVDEPIELLVNDKLIARGDVVVVDEKFGLRITEIISPRERIESLR